MVQTFSQDESHDRVLQSYYSDNPWLLFSYTAFVKIILIIFGCAGSSLLHGLLSGGKWGTCPSCGVGASHCNEKLLTAFLAKHRLQGSQAQ